MKIIEIFKRKRNAPQPVAAREFDWLGVEVPPPVVRRYFTQHAEDELDVPLAIARQVREEAMRLMATHQDADDRQVAVWQGIIVGMERFAAVYQAGVDMQREKVGAGGQRIVEGLARK